MRDKVPFSKPKKYVSALTPQQKCFCDAYLANGCDKVQAARDARYLSAAASAVQLLEKPQVKKYLKEVMKKTEGVLIKKGKAIPTFEDKVEKLWDISNSGSNGEGISAIAELNRMQGHHAAEKHINIDLNADVDISRIAEKIERLRLENKSEY